MKSDSVYIINKRRKDYQFLKGECKEQGKLFLSGLQNKRSPKLEDVAGLAQANELLKRLNKYLDELNKK